MNQYGIDAQEYMLANGRWPTNAELRSHNGMSIAMANSQRTALTGAGEAHEGANGRVRIVPSARTLFD